ncbi:DUF4232 domain-containing protein [Streptomyces iranensis]|uniref:DUF4232 domain-containing protein n=1 Tax=Streptomyces iranensis TaxID=576784 RepID=A0A060ZNL9_9ACTN|nr:DUF4232 domain-containing protein [Streptomyces iranensis]MBP2062329.1 hypothetical protein [Streptomyces iranensis]CDR07471.1 predicted protein [Streptomyces iranensis]
MKTARHTVRTVGLVAVAAAAFSLTACQSDSGKDDDAGSSSSAGASKDSGGKGSDSAGSGSAGSGGAQSGKEDSGDTGTQAGEADSGVKRSACTVGKVAVSLQETGGSAPVILLKASNNGSTRCDLYGYPFVGFPDAQSSIPAGGRKPQSVISLEPGKSAYAALGLEEGNGGNMHREKQLTVELADRNLQGTGETAEINAPGEAGLAISDNSTVSYWNNTVEEVLQ